MTIIMARARANNGKNESVNNSLERLESANWVGGYIYSSNSGFINVQVRKQMNTVWPNVKSSFERLALLKSFD